MKQDCNCFVGHLEKFAIADETILVNVIYLKSNCRERERNQKGSESVNKYKNYFYFVAQGTANTCTATSCEIISSSPKNLLLTFKLLVRFSLDTEL